MAWRKAGLTNSLRANWTSALTPSVLTSGVSTKNCTCNRAPKPLQNICNRKLSDIAFGTVQIPAPRVGHAPGFVANGGYGFKSPCKSTVNNFASAASEFSALQPAVTTI